MQLLQQHRVVLTAELLSDNQSGLLRLHNRLHHFHNATIVQTFHHFPTSSLSYSLVDKRTIVQLRARLFTDQLTVSLRSVSDP